MNTATKQNKIVYFEYLRVISAIAVIIIHVSGANWFRIEIGSFNWIVQSFFNLFGRFSVCVFCMITGALLLKPGREVKGKDVWGYIKRILIIYIVWVILYALLYTAINHGDLNYFIGRLVKLPNHLWYLLMLIGLYLALPVTLTIRKNRSATLYLILLLVIFGAYSTIKGATGFFSDLAGDNLAYSLYTGFLDNLESVSTGFLPGYLGLFFMGHYIHEYGLGKWHKPIVVLAIPALLLSGLLTVVISMTTGRYVNTFMLEQNPLIVLASAGIFAYFRGEGETAVQKEASSELDEKMIWLGSCTFGIYLIHFAVREIMANCLHFTVASYPAILSVPVNTLLIFLISLGLTIVIKKIPGIRKIVS